MEWRMGPLARIINWIKGKGCQSQRGTNSTYSIAAKQKEHSFDSLCVRLCANHHSVAVKRNAHSSTNVWSFNSHLFSIRRFVRLRVCFNLGWETPFKIIANLEAHIFLSAHFLCWFVSSVGWLIGMGFSYLFFLPVFFLCFLAVAEAVVAIKVLSMPAVGQNVAL